MTGRLFFSAGIYWDQSWLFYNTRPLSCVAASTEFG